MAVNLTRVSPIGKIAGALLDIVTTVSTLSLADAFASRSTNAASVAEIPAADVATKLSPSGTTRFGLAWSVTVTTVVAVPLFPAASVAENTTVVGPSGKSSGASLETETDPSTLSLAVALCKNTDIESLLAGVPAASIAAKVAEAGAATTGGTASNGGVPPPDPPPDPPPHAVRKKAETTTR